MEIQHCSEQGTFVDSDFFLLSVKGLCLKILPNSLTGNTQPNQVKRKNNYLKQLRKDLKGSRDGQN